MSAESSIAQDKGGTVADAAAHYHANVHAQHWPILLIFSCVKIPVNRRWKNKDRPVSYKRFLVLYSKHIFVEVRYLKLY